MQLLWAVQRIWLPGEKLESDWRPRDSDLLLSLQPRKSSSLVYSLPGNELDQTGSDPGSQPALPLNDGSSPWANSFCL